MKQYSCNNSQKLFNRYLPLIFILIAALAFSPIFSRLSSNIVIEGATGTGTTAGAEAGTGTTAGAEAGTGTGTTAGAAAAGAAAAGAAAAGATAGAAATAGATAADTSYMDTIFTNLREIATTDNNVTNIVEERNYIFPKYLDTETTNARLDYTTLDVNSINMQLVLLSGVAIVIGIFIMINLMQ